jgi:Phage portal protein, SPP1 Gp6-like
MDWIALTASLPVDSDMPARAARIANLGSTLCGKMYDHLPYCFADERTDGGDYIPIRQRRPSVQTNLCRVVVEDAVSLLFSEGHFPTMAAGSDETAAALAELVKSRALNALLIDAATRGSVGSVAILMRVLKSKPFFEVMDTPHLTPKWDATDPDRLLSVTEKYKVEAADLIAQGYKVDPKAGKHWFQRVWDETFETWYLPWPVSRAKATPQVDSARTLKHDLGFCPIVWVRNLPGGSGIDGVCTFECAINTVIETDYLLSQAGRGLRYSSDPTLVLKDPGAGTTGAATDHIGGSANALVLPPDGDAKLLEINGTAAQVVLTHVKTLRGIALEQMHGNRVDADRLSAATSGRAMELMNQGLIWLSDRMRISYGEGALLALYRMVCAGSAKVNGGLLIGVPGAERKYTNLDPGDMVLKWPDWYPPTFQDRLTMVQSLDVAVKSGILSEETATTDLAPVFDLEDVPAELARIAADRAAADKRAAAQEAAVTITETAPA